MPYSAFTTLDEVLKKFDLKAVYDAELFPSVAPVAPGELLTRMLDEYAPLALTIGTEKARSEFLIAPILAEVRRLTHVSLFSGIEFNVDARRGLNGFCDFLLSRSPDPYVLQAPVFAVVEAKNEKPQQGLGQCVAELIASRIFNERKDNPIPVLWGTVTMGNVWRFLKLEGDTVFVDRNEEYLQPIERLLGILASIAQETARV
jgi:hypothetical protein